MSTLRRVITLFIYPFSRIYHSIFPSIRILMYHRVIDSDNYDQLVVSPSRFEEQIDFLNKNYRVISLQQALDELKDGIKKSGVVITFDDGYLDNLENALPVLHKYNIPATIFVTTAFCDQSYSHPRYQENNDRLHLDWDEVKAIAEQPDVIIGSHTISHPYLSRINKEESEREISNSKKIIEKKLARKIKFFCYPSGDFTKNEIEYVRESGYEAAVTVSPGTNYSLKKPYQLCRTEINDKDDASEIRKKLAGAYDPIHFLLHLKRKQSFKKQSRDKKLNYRESN